MEKLKVFKNKQVVILLKGLPACGKTTVAREFMRVNPMFKRVNKDDLRAMLDNGKWSKENERFVLALRDYIIFQTLKAGKSVIVDDTNLHPKHEINIKNLVKGSFDKVEVSVYDGFEKDPKECIKRDLIRPRSVGSKVIMDMYNQFMKPKIKPETIKENPKLPFCIICDIDGTLAIKGDRSPYDWKKVGIDKVNKRIEELLFFYKKASLEDSFRDSLSIILMSGRDGSCKEQTIDWLEKHEIEYDHLYMRKAGDNRKDSIVKRELYEKYIKDKYNVLFVLDDRDQVVDMWRNELGLTCLQVASGDF